MKMAINRYWCDCYMVLVGVKKVSNSRVHTIPVSGGLVSALLWWLVAPVVQGGPLSLLFGGQDVPERSLYELSVER